MNISATSAHHKARLTVEHLEDRTTPAFVNSQFPTPFGPGPGQGFFNGTQQGFGGLSIAVGDLYPDNFNNQNNAFVEAEFVFGFGPGPEAMVTIFGRQGNLRGAFTPYPGFRGGINVAVGDVLGDSAAEIIVAPASNAFPIVSVFTPQGRLLSQFLAFTPFYTGGLNIAVGNVLGGIAAGGFNSGFTREFADATEQLFGQRPINRFKQEIIIGTANLSSRVVITDGVGNVQRDFFAFDPLYTGGVTLTAASVDKRRDANYNFGLNQQDTASYDEVIVGAARFAPAVAVYSVWEGAPTAEQFFYAFAPTAGLGVNVAAGSSDFNVLLSTTEALRGAEIYVNLLGTSVLRTFDGETQEQLAEVQVYPPQFSRGLNMVSGYFDFIRVPGPTNPPGSTVPLRAEYDPSEDFFFFVNFGAPNPDFAEQDLAVVSADGPFFQQPRLFFGNTLAPMPFVPAPNNGP